MVDLLQAKYNRMIGIKRRLAKRLKAYRLKWKVSNLKQKYTNPNIGREGGQSLAKILN